MIEMIMADLNHTIIKQENMLSSETDEDDIRFLRRKLEKSQNNLRNMVKSLKEPFSPKPLNLTFEQELVVHTLHDFMCTWSAGEDGSAVLQAQTNSFSRAFRTEFVPRNESKWMPKQKDAVGPEDTGKYRSHNGLSTGSYY